MQPASDVMDVIQNMVDSVLQIVASAARTATGFLRKFYPS